MDHFVEFDLPLQEDKISARNDAAMMCMRLKNSGCRLLKKIQRRGARRIDERRRTWAVRWSEAIERNEAYESFSAAC
jgi:hypothetical protein